MFANLAQEFKHNISRRVSIENLTAEWEIKELIKGVIRHIDGYHVIFADRSDIFITEIDDESCKNPS